VFIRVPIIFSVSARDKNKMLHPEQKRIYQSMTPEEKLRTAFDLYSSARELKAAGLRVQHPDWSEKKIQEEVRDIFLYATT
jgi:hypothetical protein